MPSHEKVDVVVRAQALFMAEGANQFYRLPTDQPEAHFCPRKRLTMEKTSGCSIWRTV